ncbi:MAG: amidohydrolase family protein [Candidatus Binatia bacterium]
MTKAHNGNGVSLEGAIDADGHILEPADLWEKHLEPKYRDRALRIRTQRDGLEIIEIDGKPSWTGYPGFPGQLGAMGVADLTPRAELTYTSAAPATREPKARIAHMDEHGISKTILYPTLGLFLGEIKDPDLFTAHCHAYNRWIIDFCSDSGGRLIPIAQVSLEGDPKEEARELERCVKAGAKGAFFLPFNWQRKSPGHPDYDPLWAKAQELDVPLAYHPTADPGPLDVHKRFDDLAQYNKANFDFTWYADVLVAQGMIQSFVSLFHYGLFDRFPTVKMVVLESQAGWIGYLLDRMDATFKGAIGRTAMMKEKPSTYFNRQCWISADPDEKAVSRIVDFVGSDKFFWASDYPHPDHGDDYMEELAELVEPLSETSRRQILWENVSKVYKLGQ